MYVTDKGSFSLKLHFSSRKLVSKNGHMTCPGVGATGGKAGWVDGAVFFQRVSGKGTEARLKQPSEGGGSQPVALWGVNMKATWLV